jgi:phage terminase large subunit
MSVDFKVSKVFDVNFNIPEGIDLTINRGGTSSGKTYSIMQVLLLKAGYEFPGTITTVIGQDIPNLKKGSIRDTQIIIAGSKFIQSLIKDYNKSDRIYTFNNGSILEFNSYSDEQDAKNGKRDFAFFNEINGIKAVVFEQIYIRTRIHSWADFNPSSPFWLTDKNIESRPNVRTVKSTYRNNPFLDDSTRNKILSYEPTQANIANNTADEYRWKVYGLGEYAPKEGAIFKDFRKGTFNDDIPFIWGLDWGSKHPFTLTKFAFDKGNSKAYLKSYVYSTDLTTSQIKERLHDFVGKDELIVCDNANRTGIHDLREWGFNAYPSYKGKIVDRIRDLQDYEIIIDSSPDIELEFNNYIWLDKRGEYPIDDFNHVIDPFGYCHNYYKRNFT